MDYLLAWILGLAVFFGPVFALFWAITGGTRRILGPRRRLERDMALEVLRGRLARGEITQAEYDEALRILGQG